MSKDPFKEARKFLHTEEHLPLEDVIIAVDFDGTCVLHEYPAVGPAVPGCVSTLKHLTTLGAKLILLTVRDGMELRAAQLWFEDHGIKLWAVNHNPTQWRYSKSRKVFADLYIDDCAVGVPLKLSPECSRPHVDWSALRPLLAQRLGIKF